jgi:hypothetical protein
MAGLAWPLQSKLGQYSKCLVSGCFPEKIETLLNRSFNRYLCLLIRCHTNSIDISPAILNTKEVAPSIQGHKCLIQNVVYLDSVLHRCRALKMKCQWAWVFVKRKTILTLIYSYLFEGLLCDKDF